MTSTFSKPPEQKETRHILTILGFYFLVCFPLSHIFLKISPALYSYWHLLFFALTLSVLFFSGKLNLSRVGLAKTNIKTHFLGISFGLLPLLFVVFADTVIVKTGMLDTPLFSGAELRKQDTQFASNIFLVGILSPVITQIFITGFLMVGIFRGQAMSIPGNGILFSFFNFNLGMGYLGLGMISAGLARYTGSLIPAIFFGIGCALAKFLILTSYPRVTTILVFLI